MSSAALMRSSLACGAIRSPADVRSRPGSLPPPQWHSTQQRQQQQQHSAWLASQHPRQDQQHQQQWRRPFRRRAPPCAAADNAAAAAGGGGGDLPLDASAPGSLSLQARLAAAAAWLDAFYRFSRPHTVLGTTVSVCSVCALALGPGQLGAPAAAALVQALSSALLMNICIVGLNQLYDIEIDRINKPYLPLACGDFSPATGRTIVALTGAAALAIGWASGSQPLLATLGGSLALGIAYSTDLPLLRWKRSPVLAAACILAVRAILVQLGFFFHMQLALGSPSPAITRPIAFATAFMLLFSIVIALFKDVPDVAGDSHAGVRTLSVRLGPKRVFWVCIAILEAAYAGAILVGLQSPLLWSRVATTAAHVVLGVLLMWRASRTDLSSPKAISRCYMFTWGLFYAEYLLLPLFR